MFVISMDMISQFLLDHLSTDQVRIHYLVKGAQLLRPKVANVAEQSHASKLNYLWTGSRTCLRALKAFEFFMLKYAFSHILETLFVSFLTSTSTPKTPVDPLVQI